MIITDKFLDMLYSKDKEMKKLACSVILEGEDIRFEYDLCKPGSENNTYVIRFPSFLPRDMVLNRLEHEMYRMRILKHINSDGTVNITL